MRNRDTAEFVILGVLMTEAMHGYEINKFMTEYLDNIWHISTSQIYLILHRLDKNNMVTGTIAFQENRISKKIFTITPDGKEKFLDWMRQPTSHARDIRSDFMAKLFFFKHLKLGDGFGLISAQIELLKDLREKVENDFYLQKDGYRKVVLKFKMSQFDACIRWLRSDAGSYITCVDERALS